MNGSILEALESRTFLSGSMAISNGVLYVTGASGNNTLTASQSAGVLTLKLNGKQTSFNTAKFSRMDIRMGAGNDYVRLGTAVDRPATIHMGDGNNYALGTNKGDVIYGGGGHDSLYGGGGNDVIWAGRGYEYCYGGAGNDTLHAGGGRDYLYGDGGYNYMYGGSGSSWLYGTRGYDHMYGGSGPNYMMWGGGGCMGW